MILIVSLNYDLSGFKVEKIFHGYQTPTLQEAEAMHPMIVQILSANGEEEVQQALAMLFENSLRRALIVENYTICTIPDTDIHLFLSHTHLPQETVEQPCDNTTPIEKSIILASRILSKKYNTIDAFFKTNDPASVLGIPENYQLDIAKLQQTNTQLGEGKTKVYLGKYEDKEVAIKNYDFTEDNFHKFCMDFLNEIQNLILLGKANSAHIVDFIGLSINNGFYNIVLENVSRGSLFKIIEKNPSLIEALVIRLQIIQDMIEGFKVLDAYLMVHGDVKGENFLITENFRAKLIDFESSANEVTKRWGGTIITNAPEVLNGACQTKKTDIFSLMIPIWEVLILKIMDTALPSYVWLVKDLERAMKMFLQENRAYIFETSCPFKWAMIINAGWHNDPDKRPTAAELGLLFAMDEQQVYEQLRAKLPDMLNLACKYGRLDLVKAEIENSYINERSQEGNTPLLAACASPLTLDNVELFTLLLNSRASIYVKSINGETPLDLAFKNNNDVAIRAILSEVDPLNPGDIMSKHTLELAKNWVKTKGLTAYNADFFALIADCHQKISEANIITIKNVKNTQELYTAIKQIGFFPSSTKVYDKNHLTTVVYEYMNNQAPINNITNTCGVREKTKEIHASTLIANAKSLDELLQAIDKIDTFPSSLGFKDNIYVSAKVVKFFKGIDKSNIIPQAYGLRVKAQEIHAPILIANAKTQEELLQAIDKIDTFPSSQGFKINIYVRGCVENFFEGKEKFNVIPQAYGLRSKAIALKENTLVHQQQMVI